MQTGHIESKLSGAWATLVGCGREFSATAQMLAPRGDDACFLLPISKEGSERPAAVVILLGHDDAGALAAAMFGLAPEDLSEADVQDAGAELCNILSGCMIECLDDAPHAELGLPEPLSLERCDALGRHGAQRALFASVDQRHRLAVMLVDPLPDVPTGLRPASDSLSNRET